jgi:[ribosomal protein S5]-alanine N-acetyltransferase
MIFETPRLIVRKLRDDDLDALTALYADPEVRLYFPEGVLNREQTQEELDWFLRDAPRKDVLGLRAIIHRTSGTFIGRGGLLSWTIEGREEIETTYLIARPFWRQGLGNEFLNALVQHAFDELSIARLIALIHPRNIASIKTAEKAGFAFERIVEIEGTRAHLYALSRQDSSSPAGGPASIRNSFGRRS